MIQTLLVFEKERTFYMQRLLLIAVVSAGLYYTLALSSLKAQSNAEVSASVLKTSDQIKSKLQEYETLASKYETNTLSESREAFDEMRKALQPLKEAVSVLLTHQSIMDKKTTTGLWFELLAVIDKHYDPNFLVTNAPISISGWIAPPSGYTGKIGPSGMELPDTNNPTMRAYYLAALKKDRDRREKTNFQHELQGVNHSVTFHVERFLKSSYTSSASDKKEMNEILDQSKLSDSRKQQIHNIVLP